MVHGAPGLRALLGMVELRSRAQVLSGERDTLLEEGYREISKRNIYGPLESMSRLTGKEKHLIITSSRMSRLLQELPEIQEPSPLLFDSEERKSNIQCIIQWLNQRAGARESHVF